MLLSEISAAGLWGFLPSLSLSELIKVLLGDVLLIANITNGSNAFLKPHLPPKKTKLFPDFRDRKRGLLSQGRRVWLASGKATTPFLSARHQPRPHFHDWTVSKGLPEGLRRKEKRGTREDPSMPFASFALEQFIVPGEEADRPGSEFPIWHRVADGSWARSSLNLLHVIWGTTASCL